MMEKKTIVFSVLLLLLGCTWTIQADVDEVEKPVNRTMDPAHVEDFDPVSKVCKKAPETGPCEAYMERYFFNPSSMTCEIFFYGGCLGNRNNFEDKAKCMSHCRR
ncbi:kunitz-type serine protease inhibitor C1-like [Gymnodraco acuticeps]|uniref:Kunitz-type serine protease inhibitor C1-like n=1 Tax=Gymnodraco acuticeps TaxID=8218 RepID=A0A6P8T9L1_GYMAC|nr:kunitz-type serine protease inhibitor C1-like [Gymnodraco acuticeps]